MKALTTLFVVGMFATAVAIADDADDVKASEIEHFTTQSADVITQHHLAGHTGFGADGGLLGVTDSLEEERNDRRAEFDAGLKRNLQLRHLEATIYGDVAVTTGYVIGTNTLPDGTTERVANRRTAVLIKQGGQWKEVHTHNSPLIIAPSQ